MSLSRPLRNTKARITVEDEEDRISRLPDELIHQILEFVDTKLAIQTSLLSKRWKLIWKTLPFLKFRWVQQGSPTNTNNFTRQVLSRRNHQSQISSLELAFLPAGLFAKFVEYAISHHVQYLNVHLRRDHKPYKLSNFSSNSIQKLQLEMKFGDSISELDCWDLPALNTLHLTSYYNNHVVGILSELCLTCLPALRTLCLEYFDLKSMSISLSSLTTLRLFKCKLPIIVWKFPALKSLTLHDVVFHRDMSHMFAALVTLQDLTLVFEKEHIQDCVIPSPQLENLEIRSRYVSYTHRIVGNIVVVAPKLRNFTSVGIFQIIFGGSKVDNVNIRLRGCFDGMIYPLLKEYYQQLTFMLPGFASAKILNLDLETLQVTFYQHSYDNINISHLFPSVSKVTSDV